MEYIKPEEFLKQPKKVQKEFRDWWNPEQYDLFMWDIGGLNRMYVVEKYKEQNNDKYILPVKSPNIWNRKEQTIPLFTEGQLRKFIEDKTNIKYDIVYSKGKQKFINFYDINEDEDWPIYKMKGHDLLQAYWQVACKIAKN